MNWAIEVMEENDDCSEAASGDSKDSNETSDDSEDNGIIIITSRLTKNQTTD